MPKTDRHGKHVNPECFLWWQGITRKWREFTVESKAKHRFLLAWLRGQESNQVVFVDVGKDKSSLNSKFLYSPLYVEIQPWCCSFLEMKFSWHSSGLQFFLFSDIVELLSNDSGSLLYYWQGPGVKLCHSACHPSDWLYASGSESVFRKQIFHLFFDIFAQFGLNIFTFYWLTQICAYFPTHPNLCYQFCVCLLYTSQVQPVLTMHSWMCGLPWKHGHPSQDYTLKGNIVEWM